MNKFILKTIGTLYIESIDFDNGTFILTSDKSKALVYDELEKAINDSKNIESKYSTFFYLDILEV